MLHASWTDEASVPVTFIVALEVSVTRDIGDIDKIYETISDNFTGTTWEVPYSLHDEGLYLTTLTDMKANDYLNSYPPELNVLP